MDLKYEKLILDKFDKFELKPRDNQLDLINKILTA